MKIIFVVLISLLFYVPCFAEPVQLYLEREEEAVCSRPLNIDVLVLNENGELVRNLNGSYNVFIDYEESEGLVLESLKLSRDNIKFKDGKSFIVVEDSEQEVINLKVEILELKVSGYIDLSFVCKDINPPEITDIGLESKNMIGLMFNEEVEEESALKTSNYRAVTNKREECPDSIEYHQNYVLLKFGQDFTEDEDGYVEVEGLTDLSGNEIDRGTRSPDFDSNCGCL